MSGGPVAADTNVLLRALVDDDSAPEQCAQARALLEGASKVRISAVVFHELMWTLSRRFGFARAELVATGEALLAHPNYDLDLPELIGEALTILGSAAIDFADAVAVADARRCGGPLHTFDRKLARLPGAKLLGKP
ncbi:PIN domain-containing protein [Panacagrimonas sp.]|uniref:PIN domain-containing protein n=1 Tax=Panacagrimonas sp. TaxID=2480088 RepID=UPI003B51AD47